MKTAKSIILELGNGTFAYHFGRHECYEKYIQMLPMRFRSAIGFVYVKDRVLYLALRHPGYKMEMDLNKKTLLEVLNILAGNQDECREIAADKIVLFNSKYSTPKLIDKESDTVPRYNELASGKFDISMHDKKLQEQFEKLKLNIQKNLPND